MKKSSIIALIIFGVALIAFVLTIVLTSVIVTSEHKKPWIKPGEQIKLCSDWEFTMKPKFDNVTAYLYPNKGPKKASEWRITKETLNGYLTSSFKKVSGFNGKKGEIINIKFYSAGQSEVKVNFKRDKTDDSSYKDYIDILKMKGTGQLSKDGDVTKNKEHFIEVKGVENMAYEMNVTHWMKYYILSDESVNCPAGEKITFNSEKKKGYCVVLEMESVDDTAEYPSNRNYVNIDYKKRFNTGDISAIVVFSFVLVVSAVLLLFPILELKDKLGK